MPGDCGAARGFIEYDAGSLFFSAFFDNMEGYGRVNAVRKKLLIVLAAILVIALIGFIVYWETNHGNRRLIDTKYRFNRAVIRLPNGETVEGKVSSWLDYSDSDVVQVTIGGKTYLTHYTNVCLISD